jgi:hypothetical protein
MKEIRNMLWVEFCKLRRSRIPFWTAIASLFMPLGTGLLIFAARNPAISQKLGLISVKANLVAYSSTDWTSYLGLKAMIIAAGGFFLFVLAASWVFGREFTDGTLKDLLAVPVHRSSILLAKFIVAAVWFAALVVWITLFSLLMGALIHLPGASLGLLWQGIALVFTTAFWVMLVSLPFAFLASIGRGYLLPMGLAVLTLIVTNLIAIAGWGGYFPWAIPGLLAQRSDSITPVSYWIAALTGLVGAIGTELWWKYADQNR